MEGRGPYHIYDPGGGSEENGSTALEQLVEENARLKEKMQGIKSIGSLQCSLNWSDHTRSPPHSQDVEQPLNEDANLLPQLQQLENTLSGCAKEASKEQVFVRMGYMASELKRLASKVHKNEQRTSFLQTLCETLHSENKELRTKLEHDLEQRNQALEKLRCENQELRRMVTLSSQDAGKREAAEQQQQSGAMVEKARGREELEAKEKKVKILEHQRRELLEVNKQWDQHFRSMKQKYEQKVTDLHQELAEARRAVTELESEREQKQRDFDRKLLLAKSRIETEEAKKERLAMEVRDLQQRMRFLQEQLAPVTRQWEYQEKEIQRLNKALEEALNVQASPPPIFAMEPAGKLPQQELLTQNELLKQQRTTAMVHGASPHAWGMASGVKNGSTVMGLLRGGVFPACPMYQYQYSPPMAHPMYHGYDEWQQIRYPPAMPGEHTQGQNFHHFPPPEYPWRPPCAMARSQNTQPVTGVKPVPKDLEQADPGLP
ncbi:TNFAIP3-interacting protein 1-like [Cinclus cinclus]|uniref:TNFAIP3-interacting protein 1-like n=1 Tax=Cinclus cinclus TaxID=127875 RepID=UPI002E160FFF